MSTVSTQYCLNCMNPVPKGSSRCSSCGSTIGSTPVSPNALKPGSILNGKYLIGKTLGQGGFGITYIGLNLTNQQKVAIKEFFPSCTGMVSRKDNAEVVWIREMTTQAGKDISTQSFLKEARKMAKVDSVPCIVSVRSVFSENNTCYIVMDYIEGENLADRLKRRGVMTFPECAKLLAPIIFYMDQMHRNGIIHRDISPDNIMITSSGSPMLLDLGAAKEIDVQKKDGTMQSSQLVHKNGFSPLEQYLTTEKIGPWTDVYATCATIYYCCTGIVPPTSPDRINGESLKSHPNLSSEAYRLLESGMAINSEKRIQNMHSLLSQLQKLLPDLISVEDNKHIQTDSEETDTTGEDTSNKLPSFFDSPWRIAGLIFGLEAVISLFAAFTVSALPLPTVMYIAGCLLALYALVQQPFSQKYFCGSLCLIGSGYFLVGSLSSYVAAVSLFGGAALLAMNLGRDPARQKLLYQYWYWVIILFAAYIAMNCVEAFSLLTLLLDLAMAGALYMVIHKLSALGQ